MAKIGHLLVLVPFFVILIFSSALLTVTSANSQLSQNMTSSPSLPDTLNSTVSANQSGNITSLRASEIVNLEGRSLESLPNASSPSRAEEATEESYESFEVPTTNTNVSGPEINSQSTISSNITSMAQSSESRSDNPSVTVNPEGGLQIGGGEGDIVSNQSIPTTSETLQVESYRVSGVPRNTTSLIGETSVASSGNLVFYTGNWYAAASIDGGASWEYFNSSEDFEEFCCDQRVIYDPNHQLFIWYLQGARHVDTNENIVRIAVSNDLNRWTPYDILSSSLDPSFEGHWFDYPELALTNSFLYITTNAFPRSGDDSAVIMRIPLDDLRTGLISIEHYQGPRIFTFTPVHGATDKMYWATHLTNEVMRIYEWDDNSPATDVQVYDRNIDPWFVLVKGIGKCSALTGTRYERTALEGNWCERADSRISTGWISGNTIGFFWNADAGSRTERGATFPWPYINAATFDTTNNMNYIGRPYIWSLNNPWLYASAASDGQGNIAVIAYYGNSINIPGLAVGVRDRPYEAASWNMISLANSSSPPELERVCGARGFYDERVCELPDLVNYVYKWGDYITIRPHHGTTSSWSIAAYLLEGGGTRSNVQPYYFVVSNATGTGS